MKMAEVDHDSSGATIATTKAQARLKLDKSCHSLASDKLQAEAGDEIFPANPNVKEVAGHVISQPPVVAAEAPPPPSNSKSRDRNKNRGGKHKSNQGNGANNDSDSENEKRYQRKGGSDEQNRRRRGATQNDAETHISKPRAAYTVELS